MVFTFTAAEESAWWVLADTYKILDFYSDDAHPIDFPFGITIYTLLFMYSVKLNDSGHKGLA